MRIPFILLGGLMFGFFMAAQIEHWQHVRLDMNPKVTAMSYEPNRW